MNPHLARQLLADVVEAGPVLDPFCGAGAVLVEAMSHGLRSFGVDVNPLAVLISRVKTKPLSPRELRAELARILRAFPSAQPKIPAFPPTAKVDYWFTEATTNDLGKLRALIDLIEDPELRDAFAVAFSATVRDVSLTYRGEVRLRRLRGEDLARFRPDVASRFRQRASLLLERISQLPEGPVPDLRLGSSTRMSWLDDGSVEAVVCSPPYGDDRNGVGYFQFSKNMLYWLGFSTEEIHRWRNEFLGAKKDGAEPPPSAALENVVQKIRQNPIPSNPRAEQEAIAFYCDYFHALSEMSRVTKQCIAIVIGDRRLSTVFIDNAVITTELMEALGWQLEKKFERTINKKRIGVMDPGGGTRDRSGGGLINQEYTLIYRRQ